MEPQKQLEPVSCNQDLCKNRKEENDCQANCYATGEMSFTKLDYCQYLLSSAINYTVTNLANHLEGISHDRINRYLRGKKLTPRLLWDNVKGNLQRERNKKIAIPRDASIHSVY